VGGGVCRSGLLRSRAPSHPESITASTPIGSMSRSPGTPPAPVATLPGGLGPFLLADSKLIIRCSFVDIAVLWPELKWQSHADVCDRIGKRTAGRDSRSRNIGCRTRAPPHLEIGSPQAVTASAPNRCAITHPADEPRSIRCCTQPAFEHSVAHRRVVRNPMSQASQRVPRVAW
jgi:hypothetical protein